MDASSSASVAALQTGAAYERNAAVMFFDRLRRSPDRVAVSLLHGPTYSYTELGQRLTAAVETLRRCGVSRGDRVAYAGANRSELIEYLVATLHLGAAFLPLNTRLSPRELQFILNDAGARVLVADTTASALFASVDDDVPVEHWLLVADTGGEPSRSETSVPGGWSPVVPEVPLGAEPGDSADVDPEDLAVLMYTSGTTGRPKGAMISHGNIVATVHNLMLLIPMGPSAGMLAMAPMFHVGALSLVLGTLATGGRVIVLEAFNPAHVFDALDAHPATFSFGVPAMLQAMTADPRFEHADLSNLLLMCAGAPVPESLLHRYLERGAKVTQGYGLTESTAVVSLLEADWAARKLGSAGMPYPLTAVEIRDPEGKRIDQAGVDGEIWISGRNVVQGYWNRPDDTAALTDDAGWLRTGDAGHFDADGFLYITDRVKDMVITGGENVYPAEVEKVLAGHPQVADVAVVGTPDDRWGEAVTAVVVPTPGAQPDLEALQAHARQHLGGYKVPRRLHLLGELPRNASGKVLKQELRDQLR